MLPPVVLGFNSSNINNHTSSNGSMYLGKWRNQISNKINPRYFNRLLNESSVGLYSQTSRNINTIQNKIHFQASLFSMTNSVNNNTVSFSFISDKTRLTPLAFNTLFLNRASATRFSGLTKKFDQNSLGNVVEQQFYAPGYVYSKGNSSVGVAAVFVQRRFLDNSFSFLSLQGTSKYQLYNDRTFLSANSGTGYQINLKQQLFTDVNVSLDYQSKINMDEFNLYGSRLSLSGDFDIPSQFKASLEFPFLDSNKLKLSAEEITYGQVKTMVHSGYPDELLRIVNSPISQVFKLQNLVVYSAEFNSMVNDSFSWNIGVSSRQQPSATTALYSRIIKRETAAVSYKVGLKQKMSIGEFNIFASFANKPIILGTTDFGRVSNTSLNNHIEGVMSWSVSF